MLRILDDWDLSPVWNSIFAVDDCDGMLARATPLGGCPGFVHTVPKHGRIGSLFDPGGAFFAIRGPVP
jgi:predicted enzyme related to lactoylglutathione lyase